MARHVPAQKTSTPTQKPGALMTSHKPAHLVTGLAVIAAGAASTLAAAYTVSQAALPYPVSIFATGIAATLTASLALMPMTLAPAYGDALRKGKARGQLLGLTVMILAVDGALQMNAVNVAAKALGHEHVNHLVAGAVIALFQLSTFFLRGSLIEAHHERQSAIAAERLALEQLADRREKRRRAKRRKAGPRLRAVA
jgi:hypothetical protein